MKNSSHRLLIGTTIWVATAFSSAFSPSLASARMPGECNRSGGVALREVLLPAGTEVRVRLLEDVSSASAEERQPLLLETLDDVLVDGAVVIAGGALAEGTVVRAQRRHGFGRRGKLSFTIDRAQAVDGEMVPLTEETSFRGNDRYSKAAVVTLLGGPFGIFVKGADVEVPAGTVLSAYLRGDRLVQLPSGACTT